MILSYCAAILVLTLQLPHHGICTKGSQPIRRQFDFSKLAGGGGGSGGSGGSGGGLGGLSRGLGGMSSGLGGLSGGLGGMSGGLGRLGGLGGGSGKASAGGAGGGLGAFTNLLGGGGGLGGSQDGSSSSTSSSPSGSGSNTQDAPAKSKASAPSSGGATPAGCKAYHLIGARGTSEGPGGSVAYSALERNILAAVPGGVIEEIQYVTSADYGKTVTEGADTGLKMIKEGLAKCPKTLYVPFGYSKGAMVVSQILSRNQVPSANIVAVILFGNPYFQAGATQDKCTAKSGAGVAAMLAPKLPSDIIDRVYDCCSAGDMICQTTGSIVAHLSYAQQFADGALKFAVEKLQAKLGKQ